MAFPKYIGKFSAPGYTIGNNKLDSIESGEEIELKL